MTTVAERGFLGWLAWAFFSWRGRIKRMPYVGAYFCLVLVVRIYTGAVVQWLAVNVVPPPDGAELTPAYAASLVGNPVIIPFLLVPCYLYVVLDIKRLRSIGAPVVLAFIFSGLTLFGPILLPDLIDMAALTAFAYHAILAIIPAKEDRLHPLERKARTWKAIATGNGTPRRLSGKDIKAWHIVRQGPPR